jgi:hypothetical protein
MVSDAVLDQIAEEYLESEFSLPEWRVPFHRYLAERLGRPTLFSDPREEERRVEVW